MPYALHLVATTMQAQAPDAATDPMRLFLILGGVVAVGLLVYLGLAMLFPEKLQ